MQNPFDFFDEIYCINLDSRPDRWALAQQEFATVGLQDRVQRFAGVVADNSEQGCALSHVSCIDQARYSGAGNVLIFEDDVKFLHTDLNQLSRAIKTLSAIPDWQLFYLGGRLLEKATRVSAELMVSRFWTSHSYAVNGSAFELFDNYEVPIDLWLAKACQAHCLNPLMTTQHPGYSDIAEEYVDYREQRHFNAYQEFAPE